MTPSPDSPDPGADERNVGDENVQRLLSKAYDPEVPDPAFAERVRKRMRSAARTRREAARPRPLWPSVLAWGAVAAVVIIALGILLPMALKEGPPRGEYVMKPGGRPDQPASVALPRHLVGKDGLTARPRQPAAAAKPVAVGSQIEAKADQRRRVALPDGSVLYVNRNTKLTVEARRQVRLAFGEVYVAVAPPKPGRPGGTFTVATATRTVSALGTRFAVRVDPAGTSVAVTQGKVRVSGYAGLVHAGRQLSCGRDGRPDKLTAIPRASHLLEWTKDLVAAAESPLVPDSNYTGGALIAVDPQGQEARLSLRKYNVDVHVEDGFARTTIDQTYFNHMHSRLEGTFYFPLPPDASISRLAMYVNGKLMEGGMAERAHARLVYETIMYTRKDPALLEWVDGNTFKMRVFPLEARREKRIVLSYAQRLESLYGRTEYRFPGGHNMPLVGQWSFHARAVGAAKLGWASPTHDLKARKKDGDLFLDIERKNVKPDADVLLHLFDEDPLAQATDLERFSSAEHEGRRYLMLRYRPSLKAGDEAGRGDLPGAEPAAERPRRDWVFLFESSGDRDPLLARAQVDIIKKMLEQAEHDDRFTVLAAGTHVRTWAESPQPATVENINAAAAFLEKAHLVGALDLEGALAAARPALRDGRNPHLVHVGTGIPVIGERQTDRLVKLIPPGAHYVGVGVGKRWSRSFMKEAAARTGGYFTHINPDENVNWRAFELVSTLNTPRLLNVKVTSEPAKGQFLLFADSIAQGEELCAVARFDRAVMLPAVVTVTGTLDGKPYSRQVAVQDVARGADYLPRFWAKLRIERLLGADAKKNRDEIIALSKAMYVMSPFTSLLVLENEAMYKQFKVDRGRKDHWALYPAPKQIPVVYEPDPRRPGRRPPTGAEVKTTKPTAEQVLNTIMVRVPPQFLRWPNDPGYYSGGASLTAWQLLTSRYVGPYYPGHTRGGGGGGGGSGFIYSFGEGKFWQGDGVIDGLDYSISSGHLKVGTWGGLPPASELSELWQGDPRKVAREVSSAMPRTPPPGRAGRRWSSPDDLVRGLQARGRGRLRGRWGRGTAVSGLLGDIGGLPRSTWTELTFVPGTVKKRSRLRESLAAPARFGLQFSYEGREPGPPGWGWRGETAGRKKTLLAGYYYVGEDLESRLRTGYWRRNVLYRRPSFTGHHRVFSDLPAYAGGMNTTWADIRAVLEAEARPAKGAASGKIDPAARALIEKARRANWSAVTLPDAKGKPGLTIIFDGAGRYAWRRTNWAGLAERVICDGKALWHLYDELGLGARRQVSRFHRAEFRSLVPWVLPPAEDLARGADVLHLGVRTVGVSRVGAETAKDEDGKPAKYLRVHLVFSAAGRLAERRLVEMPAGKTLYRQTYSTDGTVKWLDDKDKVLSTVKMNLAMRPAPEPNLRPDTSKLVILPLPFRTRSHVLQARKLKDNGRYEQWDADDALALIAAHLGHNSGVYDIIGHRFAGKGDRRIGFYTLMMAVHDRWTRGLHHFRSGKVFLEPMRDHPRSPLANYIAQWVKSRRASKWDELAPIGDPGEGFIQRLAGFRHLHFRWNSGKATSGNEAHRRAERQRALEYVRKCKSAPFGWAMLSRMLNYGGNREFYREVAEAMRSFEEVTGLAYVARYETARALQRSGDRKGAAELFEKLYADTFKQGVLPLIDHDFRNAFQNAGADQRRMKLMRDTGAALIAKNARPAAVVLAWQCRQVGDSPLAEELLAAAMTGMSKDQRLGVTLTAFEYLYTTGQHPRADALLEPLLADEKHAGNPWLWRLGALAASARGRLASSLKRLERAMDIEYRQLGEMINLQAVRQDYGNLLNRYQQLAQAIATLEQEPPKALLVRVIRAADRWRALDADDTAACQSAARILQALGAREMAWEYLTTPLAMRPNEAAPWTSLANQLKQQGELELADRAYESAFAAEATNARILWDRAQLLQQMGRHDQAHRLYRKIAEGKWPRQFNGIQRRARRYLDVR